MSKRLKPRHRASDMTAPERFERLRTLEHMTTCKLEFIRWAEGTTLNIWGIHHGEPSFRPAICAREAWKAAWHHPQAGVSP